MIKVWFRNSRNEERLLETVANKTDANKAILEFLKEKNFTCYYMRTWLAEDGRTMVDVGSHTEFFLLEEV